MSDFHEVIDPPDPCLMTADRTMQRLQYQQVLHAAQEVYDDWTALRRPGSSHE